MMDHTMNIIDKGVADLKRKLFDSSNGSKYDLEIGDFIFDEFCSKREKDINSKTCVLPNGCKLSGNNGKIASNFYFDDISLTNQIVDSIGRCEIDIKKKLKESVIVTGGGSFISNFKQDLNSKLNAQEYKSIFYPERLYLTWIGGSVLTQLSSFEKKWISIAEYLEFGSFILHEK